MTWLLGSYSEAYARQQYRALRQFFGWLSAEEEIPDPMAGLRAPAVRERPVPFFTSVELSRLEKACRGNTFAQRRDAAIVSVFRATGIRLAELAGIRYDPDDPGRSDVDLGRREIHVRGKGGKDRTVRIDHEAACRVDRYLRVRARHEQSYRLGLWLGTGGRGPLTGNGIYQMVRRRGDQAGVQVFPHRFRHHFSHTWQIGRIPSDASFGRPGEHALPAPQRAALQCAPRAEASDGCGDQGLHGPPGSDTTMMQLMTLR